LGFVRGGGQVDDRVRARHGLGDAGPTLQIAPDLAVDAGVAGQDPDVMARARRLRHDRSAQGSGAAGDQDAHSSYSFRYFNGYFNWAALA
jgi:hypothetical protein